jgi:hypothetical protein
VCQRQDPAASKVEHGNYQPQQTGEAISFIEVTLDFRKAKGAENAR